MKIIKKILPLVGVALFVYILKRVGLEGILQSLDGIKISYILLALFFSIPVILLQTYKWRAILKKQAIKLKRSWLLKIQLISVFYGFITPGRVGSLIKIIYLKDKIKKDIGRSSSSVVLDRVLDLCAIFVLATIGSLMLTTYFSNIATVISVFFLIFIVGVIFFLEKNRSKAILKIIYKKIIPEKFKEGAKESFYSFYSSLPKKRFLIWLLFLNIMSWIMIYTQTFFIAKALSINVPYFYFIIIFPIATLVTLIPITISGLGTREATLIGLFSIFNIAAAKVVSMSILGVLMASIPAIIGFALSIREKN